MKKSLFKKTLATALSVVMALGSSIYAFAADEVAKTPTLTVDATATVEVGKSTTFAAKGTDGTGSVSATSENTAIATVEAGSDKVTVAGVAAGVIEVTVTYGDLEKICKVTVTEGEFKPTTYKFYTDTAMSKATTAATVWAGGGKDKEAGTAYNTTTIYTDGIATKCDAKIDDAKITEKAGKVYAVVSAKDVTDSSKVIASGKPVKPDATVSAVCKASYKATKDGKYGSVVLTAGKTAGVVNVHIVQVDARGRIAGSAVLPVTVKAAAQKLVLTTDEIYNEDEELLTAKELTAAKKVSVPYKSSIDLNLVGYNKDGATEASDSSYVIVDGYDKNMIVPELEDGVLTIGTPDKDGALGTTKLTIKCVESGKTVTVSVTVTNPVTGLKTVLEKADDNDDTNLWLKGDKVQLAVTETVPLEGTATTDKVKVYVASPAVAEDKTNGVEAVKELAITTDDKGKQKVEFTASKAVKATYKEGKLVITRVDPLAAAEVWFVYTDAVTKDMLAIKAATVEAIKISNAGVAGVGK